ncbi:MAG TPA: serine hydrolase domain-containing protein [Prolixibacteraceae bacterium]|nr:serine hydrolase domain-containing protein [Prolixibacteraceae bacterium]
MKRRRIKFIDIFFSAFLLMLPFILNSVGSYQMHLPDTYSKPVNQRLDNHLSEFDYSSYIDKQLLHFMSRAELKGISLAITHDEKLVFARSYGYANIENAEAMTPSHLFRIASVSKLITTVAVLKLVEENRLSLDDKVFGNNGLFNEKEYLNIRDPKLKDITVLNLLNHSAGWTQCYGDPAFLPLAIARIMGVEPPITIDTYLKYVIERRLQYKPGTAYSYSNISFMFLGAIVEKVTGLKYEDYVRYHILYPNDIIDMHMARNSFEERYDNEVKYYEQQESEMVLSSKGDSSYVQKVYGGNDIELLGAAGAWVVSASELAKLMTLIDGYDNVPDILLPETIALMTESERPLGWSETNNGYWYRTGNFAGSMAMIGRRPDGLQWVFLSNTRDWQGPGFYKQINQLMNRVLKKVDEWPERDLFNYYYPEPLSYYPPLELSVL